MKPGDSMLHYNVGDLIGVGGMGEVYQATDSRLGREVALKLLPENVSNDPERRQRFEREARTLASLQHTNIATIHGLEEADGQMFLVMELVRGEDLKEKLEHRPMTTDEALGIALQIAEGLEGAHAQNIVHRDLKPANVKLTPEGKVKILDFGLACVLQDEWIEGGDSSDSPTMTVGMTREGSIIGTAAYMSPEQARGKSVDARTDVWAFGCILFEMLSRHGVFQGETMSDTLAAVLKSDPDWSKLPADLPSAVMRLLRRCLAKDPRDRLHSIADARLDLTDEMSRVPGDASKPEQGRGQRSKFPLWAAISGWLVVTLVVVMWFRNAPVDHQPPRLDSLTFSTRDWAADVSPRGDMITFVSDRDGTSRIWLKQLAGGGEIPLSEGSDDNPRFSPDGSQILFSRDAGNQRHLYRTPVVGSQLRKVVEDATEGDWSPDGEHVAFLRATREQNTNRIKVGVVEVQTGKERILTTIDDRTVYGLRWSPEGNRLLLSEASLTGNVVATSLMTLISVQDGEKEHITPTEWSGPFTAAEWSPDGSEIIFGQAPDQISHVSGTPSLVMTYDFENEVVSNLFWAQLRLPKGGWGATCLVPVDGNRLVVDEQTLYAELLVYDLEAGRNVAPEVLAGGLGIDRQPVYSSDNRHLIFSSNRSGNVDLWVRDLETGSLSQLTDDPAGDWDPAYSADGTSVLWSSNRSGSMEVWMAALDGSQARQVTHDGVDAENPTMTSDGNWIIYASSNDEKYGIWKIRPDGTDAVRIAEGPFLIPEVSPDGRYVAFMSVRSLDFAIHILELESGEVLPYEIDVIANTRSRNLVLGRTRWSADGTALIFIGQDATGRTGVFRQAFDPEQIQSGDPIELAGFENGFTTESLGLSPDGRWLVISAQYDQRVLKMVQNVDLASWR